jgi:hypothetical protein
MDNASSTGTNQQMDVYKSQVHVNSVGKFKQIRHIRVDPAGEAAAEEAEPEIHCENEHRVQSVCIPVSLAGVAGGARMCTTELTSACFQPQLPDRERDLLLNLDGQVLPEKACISVPRRDQQRV